jgi:hypothetical protein
VSVDIIIEWTDADPSDTNIENLKSFLCQPDFIHDIKMDTQEVEDFVQKYSEPSDKKGSQIMYEFLRDLDLFLV